MARKIITEQQLKRIIEEETQDVLDEISFGKLGRKLKRGMKQATGMGFTEQDATQDIQDKIPEAQKLIITLRDGVGNKVNVGTQILTDKGYFSSAVNRKVATISKQEANSIMGKPHFDAPGAVAGQGKTFEESLEALKAVIQKQSPPQDYSRMGTSILKLLNFKTVELVANNEEVKGEILKGLGQRILLKKLRVNVMIGKNIIDAGGNMSYADLVGMEDMRYSGANEAITQAAQEMAKGKEAEVGQQHGSKRKKHSAAKEIGRLARNVGPTARWARKRASDKLYGLDPLGDTGE